MERNGPAADAELEPPVAQNIDGRALLGVPYRMPQRQQVDRNAEPDAPRALGDGGRHDQRRRHDGEVFVEVEFGEPGAVESERFGVNDLFDGFGIARRGRLRVGARQLIEQTESHGFSP